MQSSWHGTITFFTEVKTATPQKLQLLLIEGALRLANRARQFWQQGRNDRAIRALLNAQAIVAHMLAVIDHEAGGDLAKRVSAVYEFIFRSLVKAGHRHDEKSLGDAIRILEIERETWRHSLRQARREWPRTRFPRRRQDCPSVDDPDSLSQPKAASPSRPDKPIADRGANLTESMPSKLRRLTRFCSIRSPKNGNDRWHSSGLVATTDGSRGFQPTDPGNPHPVCTSRRDD